jgi:hypothetical protein
MITKHVILLEPQYCLCFLGVTPNLVTDSHYGISASHIDVLTLEHVRYERLSLPLICSFLLLTSDPIFIQPMTCSFLPPISLI